MSDKNEKFSFTYSAPTSDERRTIEEIRNAYLPEGLNENKLKRLKKLNSKVKKTAMCPALFLGITGLLLFGAGMSLTLAYGNYVAGIAIAVIGIAVMAVAQPVHSFALKKGKEKYGKEILSLTEELLNENRQDR